MVDSKLERAIVAYLISVDCGDEEDIFHSMSMGTRGFPNTTVLPVNGTPEPKFTGDYRIQVWVSIKGSASTGTDETNPLAGQVAFIQRVQQTWDALMQTDDEQTLRYTATAITAAGRALAVAVDASDEAIQFAANNADMADFTVIEWEDAGFGQGKADPQGHDWERVLMFSALAASANVD